MCFKGPAEQHKYVKLSCIMKEAILFNSCEKQLWNLTLVDWVTIVCSAWTFGFFFIGCFATWVITSRFFSTETNSVQSLENSLDGQLKVIYGDFFKLDPMGSGIVKPPAMSSDKLFETMGVAAVPWRAGTCSHITNLFKGCIGKVFGICLRKMFYLIYMLD